MHQGKVFVDLVPGGGGAGAPGADHGRRGFEPEPVAPGVEVGVEHPVEKARHVAGCRAPVDRRAEDIPVIIAGDGEKLVDFVIKDTLIPFGALVAADAAADGFGSDPEQIGADAVLVQRIPHRAQRRAGAAVLVRAAVDKQDFHCVCLISFVFCPYPTMAAGNREVPFGS